MRDIRTEKNTVAAGAAALRHAAIQRHYTGGPPPDTAFRCASILDLLHLRWVDLDAELQAAVLQQCQLMAQEDGQSRAFA